jgi:hypothetical protein
MIFNGELFSTSDREKWMFAIPGPGDFQGGSAASPERAPITGAGDSPGPFLILDDSKGSNMQDSLGTEPQDDQGGKSAPLGKVAADPATLDQLKEFVVEAKSVVSLSSRRIGSSEVSWTSIGVGSMLLFIAVVYSILLSLKELVQTGPVSEAMVNNMFWAGVALFILGVIVHSIDRWLDSLNIGRKVEDVKKIGIHLLDDPAERIKLTGA